MSKTRYMTVPPSKIMTKEEQDQIEKEVKAEREAASKKIIDAYLKREAKRLADRQAKIDRIATILKIDAKKSEELITILGINWF